MAALAESVGAEFLSLAGLPLPATIRLSEPMSGDTLIAFSRRSSPYRIERNAVGELEIMSPVSYDGGKREQYVAGELYLWAMEHGGHTFSPNTGFTLADSSGRSPDASLISDSQVVGLSAAEKRSFAPICPDFLVEVVSEPDRRTTVEAKMEMWIANGVQLAWMIDPLAATISIYRPGIAAEVLIRPERIEATSIVLGFRLETSRLWANQDHRL